MVSQLFDGSVEFSYFGRDAREVRLSGEFNAWDESGVSMRSDGTGWWRVRVSLPAGEYRFKYVVDGEWVADYASYGVENDGMGGWNSVLMVEGAEVFELEQRAVRTAA